MARDINVSDCTAIGTVVGSLGSFNDGSFEASPPFVSETMMEAMGKKIARAYLEVKTSTITIPCGGSCLEYRRSSMSLFG